MSEIQGIAPPDTSPEKAIPIPLPTPPTPSIQTLKSWAPLYLSKTDAVLNRLSTILSTPGGTDSLLCTVCYTSLLTSSLLTTVSISQLRNTVRALIEKAITLPPNTTVIIDTSSIPVSRTLLAAKRLKALSELISDFRIFARLWGLLGIYKWGKAAWAGRNEDKDTVLRRIEYAQVLVNIAYQYLENGAYLSSKGVMGWSKEKQGSAWAWSSRFWMAHVVMDFVRLGREVVLRREREKGVGEVEGEIEDLEERKWKKTWRRQFLVNAAWAPLTMHWSLESGLVSEFWVGVFGSVAGGAGLIQRWKDAGKI